MLLEPLPKLAGLDWSNAQFALVSARSLGRALYLFSEVFRRNLDYG